MIKRRASSRTVMSEYIEDKAKKKKCKDYHGDEMKSILDKFILTEKERKSRKH